MFRLSSIVTEKEKRFPLITTEKRINIVTLGHRKRKLVAGGINKKAISGYKKSQKKGCPSRRHTHS
jgi:hypothetical protein